MNSSKNTLWVAGTGVLAVLALVATYFLLVAPKRAETAAVREQTAGVVATNQKIQQETEILKAQFATLDEQKARLTEIQSTLPAAADVPALLRQLDAYANSSGVRLTGVTPSTPAPYVSTSGDGAVAATGILQIPLAITTSGSFAQTELFVKNMQADMTRYFLVEDVSLTAGDVSTSGSGGITGSITGRIFVLDPATITATAAETPADTATGTDNTSSTESVS